MEKQKRKDNSFIKKIKFNDFDSWQKAYDTLPEKKVIAFLIKSYRQANLLSIEAAAQRLGVSAFSIQNWEGEKREMQWNTKAYLANSGQFHNQHFKGAI